MFLALPSKKCCILPLLLSHNALPTAAVSQLSQVQLTQRQTLKTSVTCLRNSSSARTDNYHELTLFKYNSLKLELIQLKLTRKTGQEACVILLEMQPASEEASYFLRSHPVLIYLSYTHLGIHQSQRRKTHPFLSQLKQPKQNQTLLPQKYYMTNRLVGNSL